MQGGRHLVREGERGVVGSGLAGLAGLVVGVQYNTPYVRGVSRAVCNMFSTIASFAQFTLSPPPLSVSLNLSSSFPPSPSLLTSFHSGSNSSEASPPLQPAHPLLAHHTPTAHPLPASPHFVPSLTLTTSPIISCRGLLRAASPIHSCMHINSYIPIHSSIPSSLHTHS